MWHKLKFRLRNGLNQLCRVWLTWPRSEKGTVIEPNLMLWWVLTSILWDTNKISPRTEKKFLDTIFKWKGMSNNPSKYILFHDSSFRCHGNGGWSVKKEYSDENFSGLIYKHYKHACVVRNSFTLHFFFAVNAKKINENEKCRFWCLFLLQWSFKWEICGYFVTKRSHFGESILQKAYIWTYTEKTNMKNSQKNLSGVKQFSVRYKGVVWS